MKKQGKKGFTIVELVIVIAVIAILAAVLIPTFSSLVKKAKLSADTQAVREMNQALAADEKLHGKPTDIETAMRVLANAGYNSQNWVCLTNGYQVYWDSKDNRCVLYNASTAQIEYPSNYEAGALTAPGADVRFQLYNNNYTSAIDQDLVINSGSSATTPDLILDSSLANKDPLDASSNAEQAAIVVAGSLIGEDINTELKSALGLDDATNIYINASSENTSATYSSGTYASLVKMQVSDEVTASSDSKAVVPNLYVISVKGVDKEGATPQVIEAAQQAAAEMVYSIFVQANTTSNVNKSASILIEAGTVLDASKHEWQAMRDFGGYFGTADDSNPIIIDGMRVTDATGFAQTRAMQGSQSKYFMTGFIGTLFGNSTVENLTFRNVTIEEPGTDFKVGVTTADKNSRNTVAIIGGILPAENDRDAAVNVTLRNIVVESNCKIKGLASVGGIVGYIGAENGYADLHGTINIENCVVDCPVESLDSTYIGVNGNGYSPVGGIIGFVCRNIATINVKNCTVSGSLKGYGGMGGIMGNTSGGKVVLNITGCDTSKLTWKSAGVCSAGANIGKDISAFGSVIANYNTSYITINLGSDNKFGTPYCCNADKVQDKWGTI